MKNFTKFLLVAVIAIVSSGNRIIAQNGAKWATGLNSITASDGIGTNNNFPLNFYTNGSQRMSLSTSGVLRINGLNGTSIRFVQANSNGDLISFPMGNSTDVLYGNGTWGPLPTSASVWNVNGNNIFTGNSGNVGIGTNSPIYKLDVFGDVRVSNNLFVGGGIIITDQVHASDNVNTGALITDTIHMNTGGVITGTANFSGEIKGADKLSVIGNSTFSNNVTVGSNLIVGPSNSELQMSYLPSTGPGFPNTAMFNKINPATPIPVNTCQTSFFQPSFVNSFAEAITLAHVTGFSMNYTPGSTLLDLGTSNGKAYINSRYSPLFINNDCPQDIYLMGPHVGFGTSSPLEKFHFTGGNVLLDDVNAPSSGAVRFRIKAGNNLGSCVETDHNFDYGFNTKLFVNRSTTHAIGMYNTDPNSTGEYFVLWGDGRTYIGKDMFHGNGSMLTVGQPSKNSLALSLVDNSIANSPKDFFNVYGNGYTEIKVYSANSMPAPGGSPRALTIRDYTNINSPKDVFVINSNGKTYAREVEISLVATFPDYVFNSNYNLKSIEEVAEFIRKNKHLPGFEKGEFYENNGINVNEMFIKQQEKIEELTLYIIELEKRLKAIEKSVK